MATILVVDDRPVNNDLLSLILGYAGHAVLTAGNGAEALELARKVRPDLVITDIEMPVMDGVQFTNSLRADPAIADIPVIFYTATFNLKKTRLLAQSCGATAVVAKHDSQNILDAAHDILGLPPFPLSES